MLSVLALARALTDEAGELELHGGEGAQERAVTGVSAILSAEAAGRQQPGSLVIVSPEVARSGDVSLDIVLRRAASAHVSCLVVDRGADRLPLSTQRLAERFGIALWCTPALDVSLLHSRIDDLVRNPDLVGAGTVRAVASALRRPGADLGELISRLAATLDGPVGLFGPEGTVLAGEQIAPAEELAPQLARRAAAPLDFSLAAPDGQQIMLVPAFPLVQDPPRFWLGTVAPRAWDLRTSHVAVSLRVAALALSAHLGQSSLSYERSGRDSRAMLRELRAQGASLGPAQIERATALGWQLFGWHVAVQVRSGYSIADVPEPAIAFLFAEAIHRHGIRMRPVITGKLAVFWDSWDAPPGDADLDSLADRIEAALREVEMSYPGVRLKAGIGMPRESAAGIADSLDDARSALAFAEAEQGSAVVRRADRISAHRLIESWIPDSATREAVLEHVEPVRRADDGGQLVLTLRTYLDLESNATATATALRVHRNTVLQRLQRIRTLLPVDLDDPSSRLTVQLALRLLSA